jgi:hypothetical protein
MTSSMRCGYEQVLRRRGCRSTPGLALLGFLIGIGGNEVASAAEATTLKAQEAPVGLLDMFKKGRATDAKQPKPFSLLIAGYGIEATPRLPAGIAQMEDGTLLFGPMNVAEAKKTGQLNNILIKPGKPPKGALEKRARSDANIVVYSTAEEGATQVALGIGMEGYDAVLSGLRTAPHPAQWTLITDDYEIRWPAKFTIRVDGDLNPRSWPYELGLDGSSENLLFLQGPLTGPEQIPPPERLVAPNQEMVDQGSLKGTVNTVIWIELTYEHGGSRWRQRFYYIPRDSESVYLLRVQGTADVAEKMFAAADLMATSFRRRH